MIKIVIAAHDEAQVLEVERYLTAIVKQSGVDVLIEGNVLSQDVLMAHAVWAKDFPVIAINQHAVWQRTLPPGDVVLSWLTRPRTVAEAVSRLQKEIEPHKLRAYLLDPMSRYSLAQGIRNGYGLWTGNVDLLRSCGSEDMEADDASEVILQALERAMVESGRPGGKEQPLCVIVFGGIAAGKTRHRRERYTTGFTAVDAGDIFVALSAGQFYEFPSHLEEEMIRIGKNLASTAIAHRLNIVCEASGSAEAQVRELVVAMNTVGYKTRLDTLSCSIEEAERRNMSRDPDNISSYYAQEYHLRWLIEAARTQAAGA